MLKVKFEESLPNLKLLFFFRKKRDKINFNLVKLEIKNDRNYLLYLGMSSKSKTVVLVVVDSVVDQGCNCCLFVMQQQRLSKRHQRGLLP